MDKPTDVLSFPLMEPDEKGKFFVPGGRAVLGDVIVSIDTARRQAEERGHPLQREVQILLVHGILHLLGHDHENGGAEAATMAAEEAWAPSRSPHRGERSQPSPQLLTLLRRAPSHLRVVRSYFPAAGSHLASDGVGGAGADSGPGGLGRRGGGCEPGEQGHGFARMHTAASPPQASAQFS